MIRLIRSTFYNESETKQKLADFIVRAKKLSMGEECAGFEQEFAQKQGRKFSVLVNSGSSANLVLLQALRNLGTLAEGDMVGFSALTWPTNVMPLIQQGLEPLAIDCDLHTLNVSLETIRSLRIKPKCIFLTNVLGLSDDLLGIKTYCEQEDIILLEDNCEALGSRIQGRMLGNFGFASTFSFFVGHHLSTIEGGMICTDDGRLHEALVMARAHGWDRNLPANRQRELRAENHVDDFFAKYTFYDLAFNVRPTEIQGFLGRIQLPHWDAIVAKRAAHFERFRTLMAGNDNFVPLRTHHMEVVSNFAVPVVCTNEEIFQVHRKRFEGTDVEIRPIVAGNMTHQPFYKKCAKPSVPCPNTDAIHARGFYFGNNPDMTEEELGTLDRLLK